MWPLWREGMTLHILVLLRMVPDVVEELNLAADGRALAPESVRMILNESDDHALEQALLLKESHGGTVTVLAVEAEGVDDALVVALAKGADEAIKITDTEGHVSTRHAASILAQVIEQEPGLRAADLILTGVQAPGDLDAPLSPVLARRLRLPHLGVVSRLYLDCPGRVVTAIREYPGGMRGEFEVGLPAVFGIQAAEKPPRCVPLAGLCAAMKGQRIRCIPSAVAAERGAPQPRIVEMRRPRPPGHAEMLTGSHEMVSLRLREILKARGLLRGGP
jgi:electron transfer flavoprotein beta subunit